MRRSDLPDWPIRRWIRWHYCWWLPTWSETRYAYYDLRARSSGWCNHCPKEGDGGPHSGYSHWRCQLRRGHLGLHRTGNYVWTDDGWTDYMPTRPGPGEREPISPWANGKHYSAPYWYRIRRMRNGTKS